MLDLVMWYSLPQTEREPAWNADISATTTAQPVCQLLASPGFETLQKKKISEKR